MQHSFDQTANATPVHGPVRRALIVDDSKSQRVTLRAMLSRQGLLVQEADSGGAALAICHDFHPDLVISDWVMPGMDGLEFCRNFRTMERDSYGYFILLTSKSDKSEIARGLDAGADDFLTKPVNGQELRARINAGERILSMERELHTKNRLISDTLAELQKLYDAIDNDLQQARTIQQSLVPRRSASFGTSRVSLLLNPCGHVGGDLVGMFSPHDGRLGFYNIDVSGHGITSAMVTARVAGYLSTEFPQQNIALEQQVNGHYALRPPCEVADMLNQRLNADHGVNEYLTMAYASANLDNGHIRFVQAGHPPPLIIPRDGPARFIGDGGLPVGLIEHANYVQKDLHLTPGDRLLFYSDGFTETVTTSGDMLEGDGLIDLVTQISPTTSGTAFLDELYELLCTIKPSGKEFEDDVSAALLEYQMK